MAVFITIPVVVWLQIGRDLITEHTGVMFIGSIGGLCAFVGAGVNYLTHNKSRWIKILAAIGLLIACLMPLYFLA
ncbi:MAG: hypothetical protein AAF206_11720 [Bacteroidota bacterium]